MPSPHIITFTEYETYRTESAACIAHVCHMKERHQPPFIAFDGHKDLAAIYEHFVTEFLPDIDCRIYGFQIDEYYPPHAEGHTKGSILVHHLLAHVHPDGRGKIVSLQLFDTSHPIDHARISYEKEIKYLLDQGFQFDIAVLHLGEDGQVASLFPHSPALYETTRLITTSISPHPTSRLRLTMTLQMVCKAKKIVLLVSGKNSSATIQKLLAKKTTIDDFPAKQLLQHDHIVIHQLQER